MEVIKKIGHYLIVKIYANKLYDEEDVNKEFPYWGDIDKEKDELLKSYKEEEIMQGYGYIDENTGFQPDDSEYDWYESVEEIEEELKTKYSLEEGEDVYVLYLCNQWKEYSSFRLLGVMEDEEQILESVKELLENEVIGIEGEEYDLSYFHMDLLNQIPYLFIQVIKKNKMLTDGSYY